MDNRNKQRITALTLVLSMLMGGCGNNNEGKNNRFELTENENNEIVAMDDSYIDSEYISNYYVVEVYNKMNEENEVYIASKESRYVRYGSDYWGYFDIFSNLEIVNNREVNESLFSFVKATDLKDYIVSLGLGQLKYSYDDMKKIYEVIKENYVYESDNTLTRKREID